MDKITVRLSKQDQYNFEVIKDYILEISDTSLLMPDVTTSNVIKQALSMAATIIENEWFKYDKEDVQ